MASVDLFNWGFFYVILIFLIYILRYMKSIRLLPVTLLWITTIIAQAQSELTLWYDEPAEYFEEAMVIGNGTMGATVFGGVHDE